MTTTSELTDAVWRKSSYSNGDGGECVEVAVGIPGRVPVRDSKDPGRAGLAFPADSWAGFVGALREGRFRG